MQRSTSLLDDCQFFGRNLVSGLLVDIQVSLQHFAGNPSEPLVQRNIHELLGREGFEEDQIRIPCVLDVMRSVRGNIANIVCVEIHGSSVVHGEEDRHTALAGNIELPLGCIGMPMKFAHATWLYYDQCCSDML